MLGPTAAAKSAVAVILAERLGGELVSVDSMQVYRGLDIGTAKADAATRARIRHHMIDLVEPEEAFTVAEFQKSGREALRGIAARNMVAVVAGGSGMHYRSLVDPLSFPPTDPAVRSRIASRSPEENRALLLGADPDAGRFVALANPRRVVRALEILELTGVTPSERGATDAGEAIRAYRPVPGVHAFGLDPGDGLPARVATRLEQMREAGLLDEVRRLADRLGPSARQAVGYKELLPVVRGEVPEAVGFDQAHRATLQLAKRQRTYFRRDPRIRWVPWSDDPARMADWILQELS